MLSEFFSTLVLKTDTFILKKIVQETQTGIEILVGPSGFEVMGQISRNIVLINNLRTA